MTTDISNAFIGEGTIIEPNVTVGFKGHPNLGPARIGTNGIIRSGTLIYGDVTIGDNFQSGHNTIIRAKVRMGNYCTITNQSTIEGIVRFGNGVRVMSHVYIPTRTWIGDRVLLGPGVTILNELTPGRVDDAPVPRGPTIEDDVMVGGGSTILPGVTIGKGSFIAAGTLVTKDIPPRSFVKGHPCTIQALPTHLDRTTADYLWKQTRDLWHPLSDHDRLAWPEDWPEAY